MGNSLGIRGGFTEDYTPHGSERSQISERNITSGSPRYNSLRGRETLKKIGEQQELFPLFYSSGSR